MFDYSLAPHTTPDLEISPPSSLAATNRMVGRIPPDPVPHLSYSQIRMFSECPLRWRLSREYAPSFVPASFVFGGAIHAAIKAFYRARLAGKVASIDEMLDAYDLHWGQATSAGNPPVRFTEKMNNADAYLDLVARMFATFFVSARPGGVVAVDEPFAVTLAPDLPPVVGRIDLVEIREDPDGVRRLHMVDLTTASRRPAKDSLDDGRLLLFAFAAVQAGWIDTLGMPLALRYDIFTKRRKPELIHFPVTVTRHGLARLIEKVRLCNRGMKENACYPAPSWRCKLCGFSAKCARWPKLPAVTAA
jgi:putative RecB family exonuclease